MSSIASAREGGAREIKRYHQWRNAGVHRGLPPLVISSFLGPIIGAGWTDLLQGLAIVVGLVSILLSIRRKQSAQKQT